MLVANRLYLISLESINFWVNYAQKLIDDGIITTEEGQQEHEDIELKCLTHIIGNSGFVVEFANQFEEDIYIAKYESNGIIVIYNGGTRHQHNIDLIDNKIHKIYFIGLNDYVEIDDYQSFSNIGSLTDEELLYITLKYNL